MRYAMIGIFDGSPEDDVSEGTARDRITIRPRAFDSSERVDEVPVAAHPSGVRAIETPRAAFVAGVTRADAMMATLRNEPGVLGVIIREPGGHLSSAGAIAAWHEVRADHLDRVAAQVGAELGIEHVRELQMADADHRVARVAIPDGTIATVFAQSSADMTLVVRRLAQRPKT